MTTAATDGLAAARACAESATAAHTASADTAVTFAATYADALRLIEVPLDAASVVDAPLWPNEAPSWATDAWTRLRARLPVEVDWQAWIDWYEERLRGGSRGEAYELVFATVPEAEWEKGAKAANAWIRAHLPKPPEPPTAEDAAKALEQKASPHIFRLDGARIAASPDVGLPDNRKTTQGFLDAARKRLAKLRERAARAQADSYLQDHLAELADLLQGALEEIDLGQLVPLLEDIESDHRHYDTPEGRAEHPVDLIAGIDSLGRSLRLLVAQYPEARDLIAHQAAVGLAKSPATAAQVRAALDQLPNTAAAHPDLVAESAVEALRLPENIERGSRTLGDYVDKLALGALDALNFSRMIAYVGDNAKKATARIGGKGAVAGAATAAGALALWTTPDAAALIHATLHDITALTKAIGKDASAIGNAAFGIATLLTVLKSLVGGQSPKPRSSSSTRTKQRKKAKPPGRKTAKRLPVEPPTVD